MSSLPRGVQTHKANGAGGYTNAEYSNFLTRNKVAPDYRGPVFTTEVIHVPCGHCGTPVDPVARVPVGRMFFHPQCLRCTICGKIGSRTLPFAARHGQAVCQSCDRNKSVALPPMMAAAVAERAKATVSSGPTSLRSIMERSATKSPTRRGHALEMLQLSCQQKDPNIVLISAEKQHELYSNISASRKNLQTRYQQQLQAHLNTQHLLTTGGQQQQQQLQQSSSSSAQKPQLEAIQ